MSPGQARKANATMSVRIIVSLCVAGCAAVVGILVLLYGSLSAFQFACPAFGCIGKPPAEIVRDNARRRWLALIRLDADPVHLAHSPEYRRVYSKQDTSSRYGAQVQRLGIDIVDVDVDEDRGRAVVNYMLDLGTKGFDGKSTLVLPTPGKEVWIRSKGLWWYHGEVPS